MKEGLNIKGVFYIKHIREGKVIDEFSIDNTVTNTGKAEVAGLMGEVTSGGFKFLAVGSSSTSAAAANTALAAEITAAGLGRIGATTTRETTTVTDDTLQLVKTFTATATQAVQEVGIFDSSSSGVMLARQTFTAKNLESGDSLVVTYKVAVS